MAFSSFQSLSQVLEAYGITYEEETFIAPTSLVPADAFLEEMRFTLDYIDVYSSEGARTELIISPILREVFKKFAEVLAFWVQKPLSADPLLSGVPDYMFGTKSPLGKKVLGTPLVLIVEAKKNDFEQGWGQCLAELIAAQKLNHALEKSVYGIVSDGNLWQFGKLTEKIFTQNRGDYLTHEIKEVFGAIDFVLKSSL